MIRKLWIVLRGAETSPFGLPLFFVSCIFTALLELITVAIIPLFVTVLLKPELLTNFMEKHIDSQAIDLVSPLTMMIFVGLGLAVFLACKAAMLFFLGLWQNRALVRYQTNLSSQLVRSYLRWSYEIHQQINSAELVRNAVNVPTSICSSLLSFGVLATELFLTFLVAIALISYQPVITLCAMVLLGGSIVVLFAAFKRKLAKLGQETNKAAVETMKWINQTLQGLKEIRIADSGGYFHDQYLKHFSRFSVLTLDTQFLVQAPRLFMEFLAVTTMIVLAVVLLKYGSPDDVLPTMALFGAASLRLMPSANRIWNAIANIRVNINYVDIYLQDITGGDREETTNPQSANAALTLSHKIVISDLAYSYPSAQRKALSGINFEILAGQTVGIAGRSGAGKSTLLDILLGLHQADQGDVTVDGFSLREDLRGWRRLIGYVPQQIFMLDDTVRRNVAFGEADDRINDVRVIRALERACLIDVINELPAKLDSQLGEGGAKLSGGQRQRIGIARALYREPAILFLDEATSALDSETEQAIAETLKELHGQVTIVIIAHHSATMNLCDKIFILDNGRFADTVVAKELHLKNLILK
jgi:ATP-binding cassette subfamily C protein